MSTDNDNNGLDRGAYMAAIMDVHGNNSVCRNDETGRRLDNGNGIKSTAGMSPEGCIAFFAENGSIVQELAVELKNLSPSRQFNMAAPAPENSSPPKNNGPKFKA